MAFATLAGAWYHDILIIFFLMSCHFRLFLRHCQHLSGVRVGQRHSILFLKYSGLSMRDSNPVSSKCWYTVFNQAMLMLLMKTSFISSQTHPSAWNYLKFLLGSFSTHTSFSEPLCAHRDWSLGVKILKRGVIKKWLSHLRLNRCKLAV